MTKPFEVNANRFDPYKNYRFRVYFEGRPVAGVTKVGGLKRTTEVIEHKEAGNTITLKSSGRTSYDPITLERGVTHDDEFERWANAAHVLDTGQGAMSLAELRRDIEIELQNEAGQPVHKFIVRRCWVSEYQALPELDAAGNAIALETVRMENEGWERDNVVTEQREI